MESEKDAGAGPPGRPVLRPHVSSISPVEDDPYDITVRPERFDQQMWLRWRRAEGRPWASFTLIAGAANGLVGLLRRRVDFTGICPSGAVAPGSVPRCSPAGLLGGDNAGDRGLAQALLGRPVAPDGGRRNRGRLAWLSSPVAAGQFRCGPGQGNRGEPGHPRGCDRARGGWLLLPIRSSRRTRH